MKVYMPTSQVVARSVLRSGAYLIEPNRPSDEWFQWKSGIRAPVYCNLRRLVDWPAESALIVKALASCIRAEFAGVDGVVGLETASIGLAALVAADLGLPWGFVRKTEKKHGLGGRVECGRPEGSNVLLIDDLVASGESSAAAVEVLRTEKGINTVGLLSVVNWGFPEMDSRFQALGVRVLCLGSYGQLLQEAVALRRITIRAAKELSAFYLSPRDHRWDLAAFVGEAAIDMRGA